MVADAVRVVWETALAEKCVPFQIQGVFVAPFVKNMLLSLFGKEESTLGHCSCIEKGAPNCFGAPFTG